MKLPHQKLAQQLKQSLAKIYLISGDELLLVQEAVDLIRQTAKIIGFTERCKITIESTEWGKQLQTETRALSLFSTKKIIELDLRGIKYHAANYALLQQYLDNPNDDIILLITTYKLDKKQEQSVWYKTAEKNGIAISIWPIAADQLPQWILQRAEKNKLLLTREAAILLAEKTEGNLLAVSQEIEKLCLLQSAKTLDRKSLEIILADQAHFDVFQLVDSFLAGDKTRLIRILKNLQAEDTELTLILWAITREIRLMADILYQQSKGDLLGKIFQQFNIWEKRQPSVKVFLKKYSYETCCELLLTAAEIDQMIKGVTKGNPWEKMERWLVAL